MSKVKLEKVKRRLRLLHLIGILRVALFFLLCIISDALGDNINIKSRQEIT